MKWGLEGRLHLSKHIGLTKNQWGQGKLDDGDGKVI